MNRIHKTVFNKSTRQWVAVSELARGSGNGMTAKLVSISVFAVALSLNSIDAFSSPNVNLNCVKDGGLFNQPKNPEGSDSNTVVIGGTSKAGAGAVVLGGNCGSTVTERTQAPGAISVAIGYSTTAIGDYSTAIGNHATASNAYDVALGGGSTTQPVVSTSGVKLYGNPYSFAGSDPQSTVSVGSSGHERTITNVAAGQLKGESTDAVNGSQLFATNQAVTAVGADLQALGNRTTALVGAAQVQLIGVNGSIASLSTAVSAGLPVKYFHAESTGADSMAAGVDAVAIGSGASAGTAKSVALGAGAVTTAAAATSSATIAGTTFTEFQGAAPVGVVSVGGAGTERQITNVAAGRVTGASTDAINGSQLFSVTQQLSNSITSLSTSASTGIGSLSTGLSSTTSSVSSLSTSASTGLSSAVSSVTSLSTSASTGIGSLSTGLSSTTSSVSSLSTSASTGLSSAVSSVTSLSTSASTGIGSLSTGLSSTTSSVSSLSTSTSTGLSSAVSSVASLSTSASTGIGSLSTGLSSTTSSVSSLSTSASTGLGSLSTGLSSTTSSVSSLSTSASTGLSSAVSSVASLSTSASTGLGSLSTGLSSTTSSVSSL
ncbi:ESPR-type extended signal peptide-containing protein, partial [Burkholderia cepacia]|uniref:ESPR-type extended signal peptide-containing protein n=1 Tax=Burkholderia cepacia TaxID=292 RepID=UPI002ED8ED3D